MKKSHEMVHSHFMGRNVHVWCYGHFGMPLLIFPSAAGFAHEWDAHGMIDRLAPLLEGGKIKLYCVESNISRTWTNKYGSMDQRIEEHQRYEAFIMKELIPLIQKDCGDNNLPLGTAGCSLGGFYAATFALKYPETFNRALCMSGRYLLTHFTNGFSNTEVYLNNPMAFVPNLHGGFLERVVNHTHINLVCGQGAFEEGCIEETLELGKILKSKGIPCTVDIWGYDSRHDWEWWRRQAWLHLNNIYG